MALNIPRPPETANARPRGEEAQRALQAAIDLCYSETSFDRDRRDRTADLFQLLWDIIQQYCRQNLSRHIINGAVVTKLLIDGAAFF
jgi:hypothetical protein